MLFATCFLDERTVGVWELNTVGRFRLQERVAPAADASVTSISFSVDGALLAMGSVAWNVVETVAVQLWNFRLQRFGIKLQGRVGSGHARALAFSAASKSLAALGDSGECFVWDWQTGECVRVFDAHKVPVLDNPRFSMMFMPNGTMLVTGCRDTTEGLKLWSARTGGSLGSLGDGPVTTALLYPADQVA